MLLFNSKPNKLKFYSLSSYLFVFQKQKRYFSERELYITNLINENTHLRETTDKLNDALSVKEAHWLNSEEQFKLKVDSRYLCF